MLRSLLSRVFGSANDRLIKKLRRDVLAINALEPEIQALSDTELQAKTVEFRKRITQGTSIEELLPEAFAVVREAARRVLGQRHYDVQLIGGMVLHRGMFAEMKTGEGKTLTVTLPVYLNALLSQGVHVITVNDYLAQRDAEWMGQLYRFLGLTVGCIVHGLSDDERQKQYQADVTYGTNSEFGFDYLRDNMKFRYAELVQRPFYYAIVDEADSILIDEARTPLIISGPAEDSSELYVRVNQIIPHLTEEDYEKEEKQRLVTLTEKGSIKVEELLAKIGALQGGNLYDAHNIGLVHHVNQALMAHKMYHRDVDYIVKDNKVIIIDEFTGRMMDGRRYSDGLHQALEAKEKVEIQVENQTLASITYQNYFRLYPKLAGMSGTAVTEASELMDIYRLEVVMLPTNVPCIRQDHEDEVYRTEGEKFNAILKLIQECHARQQPILVGTVSIEKSEKLSSFLKKHKIPHQVLNARYHEQEAQIIAEAGHPGAVTIATNMAGRGTDIKLGGNLEARLEHLLANVTDEAERKRITEATRIEITAAAAKAREAGGLFVIGTERHESRRIDNQLRGRSGRQGDPGASKFFLSLEDDLLRIFGSQRLDSLLVRLGMQEGEAITHRMVTRAIEKAQVRVEARNYDIRKQLLKYDDVMNDQRKVIYEQRRSLMAATDMSDEITSMREEMVEQIIARCIPEHSLVDQWNIEGLHAACRQLLNLDLPIQTWADEEGITDAEILQRIKVATEELVEEKVKTYGHQLLQEVWRNVMLRILDQAWKDHLLGLDHLRQGINLRAYGQRDPLNEYKHEAFMLFQVLIAKVREGTIASVCHLELDMNPGEAYDSDSLLPNEQKALGFSRMTTNMADVDSSAFEGVSRNSPCPCGSGQKFKHCHGKI